MIALALLAAGAMPHTQILQDGTVVSRILIEVSAQSVRARLSSPAAIDALLGDREVVSQVADGDCFLVQRQRPHPLMDVRFSTRACATDWGFEETLVSSDQLSSYYSSWRFESTEGGTAAVYTVRTSLKMPATESLVRRESVKGAQILVRRLQGALEG